MRKTILELETLISDCIRSKISEYNLWTKADGKQEVKAYLRTLKLIFQDILADLGFENLQYLWFEYREVNGERRSGPANEAIWLQITVRQIEKGHVLVTIIIFQDGSWVKINLSFELIYDEMESDGLFNFCKLQNVYNSSLQLMSCRCIGSDHAQHSRECKVQERSFCSLG